VNRVRAGHAVNPRFPVFDEARLSRPLANAAATVEAHFGVRVDFGAPQRVPVDALFAPVPAAGGRLRLQERAG